MSSRRVAGLVLGVVSCWGICGQPGVFGDEVSEESRRRKPLRAADLCEVADSNLSRAAQAILRDENRELAPPVAKRWDGRSPLKYQNLFERRFGLRPNEKELLQKNGFVVLQRETFPSYAHALHEVYQSQLPLFVSMDALLFAVYAPNDHLMAQLEDGLFLPKLQRVLTRLKAQLVATGSQLPLETRQDLELYLNVAHRLLWADAETGKPPDEVQKILDLVLAAKGLTEISLFGCPRIVDFSQYTPRGHYTETKERAAFFRAVMWLSRLELNLVSRSSRSSAPGSLPDPLETPREVRLAVAIAQLCEQAGVMPDLAALDKLWTLFAGQREDVSVPALLALSKRAGLSDLNAPDLADRLRAAIGKDFSRRVPLHYMPPGTTTLPVIATLLGPRIVADAAALRPLLHDQTLHKYDLRFAEVAFGLGHDRGLHHLTDEVKRFAKLPENLRAARGLFGANPGNQNDLYSAWFSAVRALSAPLRGVHPSFMDREAYADFRLNSAAAGFAQIKHNYVLTVGQPYFFGGCEIPDGYVEPNLEVLKSLRDYARRGELAFAQMDPKEDMGALQYFRRLGHHLDVLSVLVEDELSGKPLSADAKRYLSMVVEMAPGTTGGPPTYTGWYFDLFRQRSVEGLSSPRLIADYYTSTQLEQAFYVGIDDVRLGLFVVDVGGPPRLVAGPVVSAYETRHSLKAEPSRLSDETALTLPGKARLTPWAQSYVVQGPTNLPRLTVAFDPDTSPDITVEAPAPLGAITFSLLDHHRRPVTSFSRVFPKGKTVFRFPPRLAKTALFTGKKIGGLSLRQGEFFFWAEIDRRKPESGIYKAIGPDPDK